MQGKAAKAASPAKGEDQFAAKAASPAKSEDQFAAKAASPAKGEDQFAAKAASPAKGEDQFAAKAASPVSHYEGSLDLRSGKQPSRASAAPSMQIPACPRFANRSIAAGASCSSKD